MPILQIDFGNGSKLTRTLNGNIATYALSSDGQVLDVLPGIYEPRSYLANLEKMHELNKFSKDPARLMQYHKASLKTPALKLEKAHKIEGLSLARGESLTDVDRGFFEDTFINETLRRRQIHTKLAAWPTNSAELKNWLYREVLHCDLSDPYLGLSKTLFASYPFKD